MKKWQRQLLSGASFVIVFLLIYLSMYLYFDGKITVTKEVNLRGQPTRENEPYFIEIPYRKSVKAFFELGEKECFLVEYKDYYGFVPSKYVCSGKEITKLAAIIGKAKENVILRVQPNQANYPYHMVLEKGQILMFYPQTIHTDADYFLCSCNGFYGFIPCEYVESC